MTLLQNSSTAWTSRRIALATTMVAGIVAGVWLIYLSGVALLLMFVAILLSTALVAPAQWLERLGASRALAAITVHLVVVTVLVAAGLALWPLAEQQAKSLVASLPGEYENLHASLAKSDSRLLQRTARWLPPRLEREVAEEAAGPQILSVWQIATITVWGVFLTFATTLLSIYWSIERPRAIRAGLLLLPLESRPAAAEFVDEIEAKLGAFVRGQSLLCVLVGAMTFLAYWLIGLPYAALLAVVAGLLEAIPVLGPVVATIPAALVALSLGPTAVVWVLVASFVIASIESYLLVPRIMNRSVGLHPVLTLLAITALFALLGPIGGVLAVPLAAIMQLVFQRFVLPAAPAQEAPPVDRRDQRGVLAYRATVLFSDLHVLMCRPQRPTSSAVLEDAEEEIEVILHDLGEALQREAQEEAPA
jgi:predicted PurR-regulated permease PerM